MRGGIDAVGRQTNLDQEVVLDVQVLLRGHTDGSLLRQFHDAGVVRADAQLVLGAEHAQRLDAADLRTLDLELLVAARGVEHRAYRGAHYLEARAAVRRTADDLQRLAAPDIHRRDMQVVRIGMVHAGEHLADHDALQTAADGLDLLEALDFQPDIRQDAGDLFGRQVGREVTLQPVVRNIHIVEFEVFIKSDKDRDFSSKTATIPLLIGAGRFVGGKICIFREDRLYLPETYPSR